MSLRKVGIVAGTATVFAAGAVAMQFADDAKDQRPARAADAKPDKEAPKTLRDFMRIKLVASNQILEGLAVEDFALIEEGARSMHDLSGAERWKVHSDVMYAQFSAEFRRDTQDLIDAANKKNMDQAALKWMAATMDCIECHRYVRNTLVAGASQ
jgi:hypothetical protein